MVFSDGSIPLLDSTDSGQKNRIRESASDCRFFDSASLAAEKWQSRLAV